MVMRVHYKKIRSVNRDEHLLVMEEYLGRPLEPGEIVHHVDEDKTQNDIENLELCLRSIHAKYHSKGENHFNIGQWSIDNAKGYTHGTYACYTRTKCRCEPCRKAASIYKKEYRRRTGIH